jgi:hypothetical protein
MSETQTSPYPDLKLTIIPPFLLFTVIASWSLY